MKTWLHPAWFIGGNPNAGMWRDVPAGALDQGGSRMAFVASKHDHLRGRVIGTGHCVPFVREVTGAPHTSQWRRGERVHGANLPPGTAIATFASDGRYDNRTDGSSHAAVFLEATEAGIIVADQWFGQPVHERLIRFRGGHGSPVNDGDAYHVIEAGDIGFQA